jgi:hypothetical protein
MTVAGHYSTRNYTFANIQSFKGKRHLTKNLPITEEEAAAAEQAGTETLNIRHNPERPELSKALRDAAPNSFMSLRKLKSVQKYKVMARNTKIILETLRTKTCLGTY